MPARIPSLISAGLTIFLLILFVLLFLLVQMLALNGASERQGIAALGISLICQGASVILAALLAWRMTSLIITKLSWNTILAVVIAVVAGTFLGGLLSFLSIIIAIPMAGIR